MSDHLTAVESYGFVLAGGYAISENGIGQRPSSDVDLFTRVRDPIKFDHAVEAVRQTFDLAHFHVEDNPLCEPLNKRSHIT